MARAVRALVRLIDERQIELIHSFLYRANVLARIATRFSRARPIVLSGHHSLTPPPSGGIAVWSERLTHRMSDLCVAVSPAVRDRLVEHDRAPREKVVVVPNGVDTRHFLPTEREPSAGGKLVIGAAGRLSPVKGFDILMAVVAVLRNRGLDVELRVAGSGSEEQPLREAAHRLGLNGHVRMLGALPDLAGFYSGLDAFVLSSLEEASPTVVLEAMACGLPVVATRCGGARDMIEHEVSGLFVTPGSRAELAEGIARVAGDARLRASLAARARERAVERFDVTAMVDNHARLYRSCLEHRAVPS
jgi:glycosyltransferase involved in cell wall biosynthesis